MIIYFIKIWKLYLYCIHYFVLFLIMFYSIVFFPLFCFVTLFIIYKPKIVFCSLFDNVDYLYLFGLQVLFFNGRIHVTHFRILFYFAHFILLDLNQLVNTIQSSAAIQLN